LSMWRDLDSLVSDIKVNTCIVVESSN